MVIKKHSLIKYILFSALLLTASGARALGLMPFGIGLYISMVCSGLSPLILSPVFIVSSLIYSFDWITFLGSLTVSVVITGARGIKKIKDYPSFVYYIIAPFSLIGYLPLLLKDAAPAILFVFLVPLFVYVGHSFFHPILKRGLKHKLLDAELIFGGVILCVVALGLFRVQVYYFPIVAVFSAFLMLLAGRVYGPIGALVVGLCFGIGGAIYDFQIMHLAYFSVMALLVAIFIPAPRIISAISSCIGYTFVTFFFNLDFTHAHLWIIAILLGGLIYTLIPKKSLNAFKEMLNPSYSPLSARYNINLLKNLAAKSIFGTSEVFEEMSRYLLSTKEYQLKANQIVGRIKAEVCSGCNQMGKCKVLDEDILSLAEVSVLKGRASVIDLPSAIIEGCKYSAGMITATAKVSDEYHIKQQQKSTESMAKGIVAELLLGMGDVLKNMSSRLASPVSLEFEKERKIKEELTYRGIYCHDVVLSLNAITMVLAKENYDKAGLTKILKKVTKQNYAVLTEEEAGEGMLIYATLLPVYDVVFSVANLAKDEISGDTHSFIRIGTDKFLMALCDGMGSGERAERFASNTISLIECFYKAGFDHASVIKSVNRFLSLSGDECFAASDICVLDLNLGIADIFKIGSPACFIKSKESVRAIEGSSLPIGVSDSIKPSFSQTALSGGDMIVLLSDGISDCFMDDTLAAMISGSSDVSPKALCENILNKAKEKCSKHRRDDMTVMALRIFEGV